MTSPIDDYQWSVRFLERIFRICGQDVLSTDYRRTAAMYAVTMVWICIVLSYAATYFDPEHYDASVRYTAASFSLGSTQVYIAVNNSLLPNKNQFAHSLRYPIRSPSNTYGCRS